MLIVTRRLGPQRFSDVNKANVVLLWITFDFLLLS